MRSHPNALMLFAAGKGTRMGALTATRPKPLIEVGGRALIDHALDQVQAAGIGHIVINLHYLGDQIMSHLTGRQGLVYSDESEALLETGGGLRQALPLLGTGPVFTLNTDAVWTGDIALCELARAWRPEVMDGLLLLVAKDQATGHKGQGDFAMAADGALQRGVDYIYTGAQIIRTDHLASVAERAFSLNRIWDMMLAERRLFGIVHRGGWCDVGHPASIPLAEALLDKAKDV
ncbi:MAG: nucleotidyltransferase family protein [Rhodobacteraceae bacterium]|nr:nucleotidyltransferase family protein [Paracoccaceae bacterium]